MSNAKRFIVSSGLVLVLAVGLTTTAMAGGRKDHKVSICHRGHEISVAAPAMSAHMAHGDVPVDDYGECP